MKTYWKEQLEEFGRCLATALEQRASSPCPAKEAERDKGIVQPSTEPFPKRDEPAKGHQSPNYKCTFCHQHIAECECTGGEYGR